MTPFASTFTFIISAGAVLLLFGVILWSIAGLCALGSHKAKAFFLRVCSGVHPFVLPIAFVVALFATVGSIIYSDVIGFDPCLLCWVQRIFLYPQVVILAVALLRRDGSVIPYVFALSLLGALVALYHYGGQIWFTGALPCPADGPSCAQRFFVEFGFVTIPLLSFAVFAFLSALFASSLIVVKKNSSLT